MVEEMKAHFTRMMKDQNTEVQQIVASQVEQAISQNTKKEEPAVSVDLVDEEWESSSIFNKFKF